VGERGNRGVSSGRTSSVFAEIVDLVVLMSSVFDE